MADTTTKKPMRENRIIRNVRCAYPHLFTPTSYQNKGINPYWVIEILIPKDESHADLIKSIKDEMSEACKEQWGENWPDQLKGQNPINIPWKDGDKTGKDYQAGHYVVSLRCRPKNLDETGRLSGEAVGAPNVVLPNLQPAGPGDVQSGDWVNVQTRIFTYRTGAGGVGFDLSNVQLVQKGDTIGGGRQRPEEVFEKLDVEHPGTPGASEDEENPFTNTAYTGDSDPPF